MAHWVEGEPVWVAREGGIALYGVSKKYCCRWGFVAISHWHTMKGFVRGREISGNIFGTVFPVCFAILDNLQSILRNS